ncbi:MAG: class I SAM-dependent methyltransferase [Alphaproteobacteria bacterium]|nr:class I SAM-dependent methyltransferase [Alphaproteobacteria bacterium]
MGQDTIRHRAVRTLINRFAANLEHGTLQIDLPGGGQVQAKGSHSGPDAQVSVHRSRAARRALFGGSVGLADAYIDGDWDSNDLTSVIELCAQNIDDFEGTVTPMSLTCILDRLRHYCRANTRAGSRRNIAAHYDLGNAFYSQWLDPSMTYSAARFVTDEDNLTDAQANKFDSLASMLNLQDGDHVLEIGCGWGAFAIHIASKYKCRVTALTVSPAQAEWARQKVADAGLTDRVEIRLQDYRDVEGQFDKIASIEMFEAVGEEYWPVFFETVSKRLRAGGLAALQVITIDNARYETYRRNPDFIQMRIFPGGMLPSVDIFTRAAADKGLQLDDAKMFGGDYAETLRRWRVSFEAAWPNIMPMGFDERFRRLWRYYLCYCEAGFRAQTISVGQFRLQAG